VNAARVRAASRDVTLIVLSVLLLVTAGGVYWIMSGKADLPAADAGGTVTLHCSECKADTKISRAELRRRESAHEFERSSESRATFYKCDACGKMKTVISASSP